MSEHIADENMEPYVFGLHNREISNIGSLIMLGQVRPDGDWFDPVLFEDIARNGLENEPTVALQDPDSFKKYVEFTNDVWRNEINFDDFPAQDVYRVVISGHRRMYNVWAIANLVSGLINVSGGYADPSEVLISHKTVVNPDPYQILSLQLGENIYQSPPPEREAMAIVESYKWGLDQGSWSSAAEFSRATEGRFSPRVIREALLFVDLADDLRELVFAGAIHYGTGVELGRTKPALADYYLFKYFDGKSYAELTNEQRSELDEMSNEWLGMRSLEIQDSKLNRTAAQKKLRGYRKAWSEEIEAAQDNDMTLDLEMADPEAEFRLVRRKLREEYQRLILQLEGRPALAQRRQIEIHKRLSGVRDLYGGPKEDGDS
jgi:hypothetical protein